MKKAVMYGAGNIGRGFIGQLLSQSGYEVVFIDVNTEILEKLNNDGEYPVRILSGNLSKEITVKNVRGVNGTDIEKVAAEIATADIMATAVGVNVLPRIVKPISEGLKKRWQLGNMQPLNIIICENLMDANHYLSDLIKKELSEDEKSSFENLIGLVEASIGRMVPVMTPEMQEGNILRICVEEYSQLPVDKEAFKGEIPIIKNLLPYSPFSFYIQRKLFIHNMGHALTAYLGKQKGYTYIWEAIKDPYIKLAVFRTMQDVAIAMSKEHGIDLVVLLEHVDDLIYRFGNKQLGDTVNRVGNDTKRKLLPKDRLIGAANLCMKYSINPAGICLGIAAAIIFDKDPGSGLAGVWKIIDEKGYEGVLEGICGLEKGGLVWEIVMEYSKRLAAGDKIEDIIESIPEIKRR